MANFDPPFASVGGVNRSPTTDEQRDGFSCGAADQTLFNRLFGGFQAELKAIQDAGGITGSEADDTTVLQAIMALIAAATGGGDTSEYVLFSQAQARFPIFPEVSTNNGIIGITAPSTGTVRVPSGAQVLHRGIGLYPSVETDLATVASKTYHVRWNKDDGYALKDLSDSGYNAGTLSEDNAAFDSTYDDMLVARVVTNSSNVATITNLKNLAHLWDNQTIPGTIVNADSTAAYSNITANFDWARTPKNYSMDIILGAHDFEYKYGWHIREQGVSPNSHDYNITRYRMAQTVFVDHNTSLVVNVNARA